MQPLRLAMAFWWSLALFWLATRDVPAEQSEAHPPSAPAAKSWPVEEVGFGQTYDEARKEAARALSKKALDFLLDQTPPISAWQPTPEYIERHVLDRVGKQGPDFEHDKIVRKTWIFPVHPLDLAAIRLLDQEAVRQQRAQQRTLLFGQITAGLALVLAAFLAYLRIDAWTDGRHRRLLQMGAAALLVGAGAVWWWLRY